MCRKTREELAIDAVRDGICDWLATQTPDYSRNHQVIRCMLPAVLHGINTVEPDILTDQDKESGLWQWYAEGGGRELITRLAQGYMATKGK